MRLLLDTHIFLWYITGNERITPSLRQAIAYCDAAFLSVVSLWEVAVKYNLGKLPLPERPFPWLSLQRQEHGLESLPLDESAVRHLDRLPPHHRDPFDRMLICQAIERRLQVVTADSIFSRYDLELLEVR